MKKFSLAVAILAISAGSGFSADLPARTYTKAPSIAPLYDWSGFYVGGNAGGGSSHDCWTNTSLLGVPTVPNASEGCYDSVGLMVGGQLGYRWQSANFVFGVEAEGDWANLSGNGLSQVLVAPQITNQTKTDAIGLFTGQVGYAWDNILWYVKGGAAVTHNTYSGLLTATNATVDSAGATRWGGTVGTGVEIGFAPNWSVGFEYDHVFMSSRTVDLTTAGAVSRSDSIGQGIDIATVSVNYHWGAPIVARY